jgi:3D (Asp-Asp-Asp) domain-containing protein
MRIRPPHVRRLALLVLPLLALLGGGPAKASPISQPGWLAGVELTQYWPVPEAWFTGELVAAPGLPGLHPIDWLYSARGVSMQGTGIADDGQYVHIDALGQGGWVTLAGSVANFAGSAPYWRAGGYWRNGQGGVTFPLQAGGWSNGLSSRYVPLPGVTFAPGPGRALTYWESVAVDPRLIPLGSWIYIPAYVTGPGRGWFLAQDTGGAIVGRHLDLYRPPPAGPTDPGTTLFGAQIYVLPPGQRLPSASTR